MRNNQRGLSLFEMLATISIASIVMMMLMSILFTTLRAKNQMDYTNRLDDEIYEINDYLSRNFQSLGYRSVKQYDNQSVLGVGQSVFLFTTEFVPEFQTIEGQTQIVFDRSVFSTNILLLDISRSTLYYSTLFSVDPDSPDAPADQIADFIANLDAYVSNFVTNNPTGSLTTNNLIILEGSSIEFLAIDATNQCSKVFNESYLASQYGVTDLVSDCASAFIEIQLVVSFELNSGNQLPEKRYYSTLFY